MKVIILCDEEEDELDDQFELWSLLNKVLIDFPKSVSLEAYSLNYDLRHFAFKVGCKE